MSKQNERQRDSSFDWEDPSLGTSPAFSPGLMQYPSYYVQSPSRSESINYEPGDKIRCTPLLSPVASDPNYYEYLHHHHHHLVQENAYRISLHSESPGSRRSALSRCSSSRNSAPYTISLHDKRSYKAWMPGDQSIEEEQQQEEEEEDSQDFNFLINVGRGLRRLKRYPSNVCICLQILMCLLLSLGITIVLFSLATRPPPPELSVKRITFEDFRVAEGSDKSGVPTKVLSCNCTVTFELDNRSEFFGVHLHPARITMSFADLTVATGHGRELYVDRDSTMTFNVRIAAKRKAVYGAGPSMASLLESEGGLPLSMDIDIKSDIRVVWDLVNPKFKHRAYCQIVVDGTNEEHRLRLVNTTCVYHSP